MIGKFKTGPLMSHCRITAVLTAYNSDKTLHKSINSLLSQSHPPDELILVNDGSTDHTLEVLRAYESRYTNVVVLNPGRIGRAAALNLAVFHATSDFIANQDADDVSYPDRLQKQLELLKKNTNFGAVGAGAHIVYGSSEENFSTRLPSANPNKATRSLAKHVPFPHTLATFRKEAWEEAGGYPDVRYLIDYNLWVCMARKGWRLSNVPEPLGTHYKYESSYWATNFPQREQQRALARLQSKTIKDLNLPFWMFFYPFLRYFGSFAPQSLRVFLRRFRNEP